MLASLVNRSPIVRVTLDDSEVFVNPIPLPGHRAVDPVVRGTVLLSLSTTRAIKKVKVILEGQCDVFGGSGYGYESTVTLHEEVEVKLDGETLGKGEHGFGFAFTIPSTTATYQRCEFGRIRHSVKATVDFAGALQPAVTSAPVALWIMTNPYQPGEDLSTQLQAHQTDPHFGMMHMVISSPHLTVAGLINLKLDCAALAHTLTILSVQGVIYQHFEISYANSSAIATPPPQRHTLARIDLTRRGDTPLDTPPPTQPPTPPPELADHDGSRSRSRSRSRALTREPRAFASGKLSASTSPSQSPSHSPSSSRDRRNQMDPRRLNLWKVTGAYPGPRNDLGQTEERVDVDVEAGQGWTYSRVMRIPDDNYVRATTLDGSEDRIRVSHALGVEVTYRLPGETEERVLKVLQSARIASCCCLRESVLLPGYDDAPPEHISHPADATCRCFHSVEELVDLEGEQLGLDGQALAGGVPVAGEEERGRKTPGPGFSDEAWRAGVGAIRKEAES